MLEITIYKRVLVGGNQKNYNKLSFIIHNERLPPMTRGRFYIYISIYFMFYMLCVHFSLSDDFVPIYRFFEYF